MKFLNEKDALNYIESIEKNFIITIDLETKELNSIYNEIKSSKQVNALISDALTLIKNSKYKYIELSKMGIFLSNQQDLKVCDKIFFSRYGLEDICIQNKNNKLMYPLAQIIAEMIEDQTGLDYYPWDNLGGIHFLGQGNKNFFVDKGFTETHGNSDDIINPIYQGWSKRIKIKGSRLLYDVPRILKESYGITFIDSPVSTYVKYVENNENIALYYKSNLLSKRTFAYVFNRVISPFNSFVTNSILLISPNIKEKREGKWM